MILFRISCLLAWFSRVLFTPGPGAQKPSHSEETSQHASILYLLRISSFRLVGLNVSGGLQMTNVTTGKARRGAIGLHYQRKRKKESKKKQRFCGLNHSARLAHNVPLRLFWLNFSGDLILDLIFQEISVGLGGETKGEIGSVCVWKLVSLLYPFCLKA